MLVEKDIARVSIGSYVVKIIKQRGQNRLKQEGWVRDLKAIESLIDLGVERVMIDTRKTLESPTPSRLSSVTDKTKKPKKESFSESIDKARIVFNQSKEVQKNLLADVVAGKALDLDPIIANNIEITEAVFNNPDALACIINIRIKDEYLLEHSASVAILMTLFSRYLGIDKNTTKELAMGAFLHDVGKIMIDDLILNKPGKLSLQEFEIIKSHVDHSVKIIQSNSEIPKLSLEVAALHHEKLDGTGYPNGLSEDAISRYGRMIAICDIYDALTATRVYKLGMSQSKAFAILLDMASKNILDMLLVNNFIKCLGVFPVGSLVKLNTEQLAVVESQNIENPLKPKVKVFYSTRQEHFLSTKDVDLSSDTKLSIEKGVNARDFDLDLNKILDFLTLES